MADFHFSFNPGNEWARATTVLFHHRGAALTDRLATAWTIVVVSHALRATLEHHRAHLAAVRARDRLVLLHFVAATIADDEHTHTESVRVSTYLGVRTQQELAASGLGQHPVALYVLGIRHGHDRSSRIATGDERERIQVAGNIDRVVAQREGFV